MRRPARAGRARAGVAAAYLGLCVVSGCIEVPEFSSESVVDRPRVLAVVAEPPEVTPGQGVTLSVLIAGARETQVQWRACSPLDAFSSNGQYGENAGDQTCGDDAPLAFGQRVSVPAELTQRFFGDDEQLRMRLGTSLPGFELDEIRATVGMTFTVEAEVIADGKRLRAQKRVLLRDTDDPHRNPPVPAFTLADRAVQGDKVDSLSFACQAADGGAVVEVQPGAEVKLAPSFEGAEEPWLERYTVLDASGTAIHRAERAFYTWFVTAGTLDKGTTRSPTRDNVWTAPSTPGCAAVWLVVRDGHGGESACGMPVSVGTTEPCELGSAGP